MMDAMITALEATWELDPVRLEGKIWDAIAKTDKQCYNKSVSRVSVEEMSNEFREMPHLSAF